jgi:hypothetical protein
MGLSAVMTVGCGGYLIVNCCYCTESSEQQCGLLIPNCSIRFVIANGVLCGNGSGLWGSHCRSSAINKENCALRCVSHSCYDSVYGNDHVSLTPFPPPFFLLMSARFLSYEGLISCIIQTQCILYHSTCCIF